MFFFHQSVLDSIPLSYNYTTVPNLLSLYRFSQPVWGFGVLKGQFSVTSWTTVSKLGIKIPRGLLGVLHGRI